MLTASSFATTTQADTLKECPNYPGYKGGDVISPEDNLFLICKGNDNIFWGPGSGPSLQSIWSGIKNAGNAIVNLPGTMPNVPQG